MHPIWKLLAGLFLYVIFSSTERLHTDLTIAIVWGI